MELREHCYSVLIVSSSAKFSRTFCDLLPSDKYSERSEVGDVGSAKRALLEIPYDIVVINTPLPDDFGTRFALDVCETSGAGVMLLVKSEHYSDISGRVSGSGVLVLPKPVSSQVILQSLTLLASTRERLRRMEQKAASVEEKLEEIRIVNRAKWVLIEHLKMTESEAHRYIEKQAMDRCVTRRRIAENIISTYK